MLDNNFLDVFLGFLLKMFVIRIVYRYGNYNYFKFMFMWYYTDVGYCIIFFEGVYSEFERNLRFFQFWVVKIVIGMKIDFFEDFSIFVIL